MRIWGYNTHTWSSSLKGQVDEDKGTKRISWFGHQSDSNGTQNNAKFWWSMKKNDIENGWAYRNLKKYDENWSIKEWLDEYSDSLEIAPSNLVELTNWTVVDILNYQDWDLIDAIETKKFWLINFSNELNKYTVARNKEFFEILDQSNDIEVKIFDWKVDWSTLIYVDSIIDWKRRAEAITLASLSRLLWFKWDFYIEHLKNFHKENWFNVTKIVKWRKKIRRNNNVNMVKYNDVA